MSKKVPIPNPDYNMNTNKNSFKLPDISLPDSFYQNLLEFEDKYSPNQNEKKEENQNINNEKEEGNYELLEPNIETEEGNKKGNLDEYYNKEFFGLSEEKKDNNEERNKANNLEENTEKLLEFDDKNEKGNSQEEGKFDINDFFFGEDNDNEKGKNEIKKKIENEENNRNEVKNINKVEDKEITNSFLLTEEDINIFKDNIYRKKNEYVERTRY